MSVVIDVNKLGKLYRLGKVGTGTLSHDLKRWWAVTRGKDDPFAKVGSVNDRTKSASRDEYVWALRDISFQISQGDVVGVIGKNGAGKSTLLKILSRITGPTVGEVKLKGRIASLLEVGTGFHPEMTGRENVYMNGTVLGMRKFEIQKRFDDIVDFAGVAKYIDTPVKRYSSGMMVRLGFAVAAFLEPEILIVDEVLAVGDAEFQKKCLGKLSEVSKNSGRTILFVSHNMGAIKSLCTSGILLQHGMIGYLENNIEKVINKYYELDQVSDQVIPIADRTDRGGDGSLTITSLALLNSVDNSQLILGNQIGFGLAYRSAHSSFQGKVLISINNLNGECVVFMDSSTIVDFPSSLKKEGEIQVKLSRDFGLPVGLYFINTAFFVNNTLADYVQSALTLNVVDGLFFENGKTPVGKSISYVKQDWKYN